MSACHASCSAHLPTRCAAQPASPRATAGTHHTTGARSDGRFWMLSTLLTALGAVATAIFMLLTTVVS